MTGLCLGCRILAAGRGGKVYERMGGFAMCKLNLVWQIGEKRRGKSEMGSGIGDGNLMGLGMEVGEC